MRRRWILAVGVAVLLAAVPAVFAQGRKKDSEDDKFRMVQGTVTEANDNAVEGAVVQLKNARTLQVRSFITKEQGAYYFHGLDPNVDYVLKAEYQGASSQPKTLSSFDSRKQPVINLKLETK